MFQSLLHQGISLLIDSQRCLRTSNVSVSIPSSSGHQFTELPPGNYGIVGMKFVSIPSSSGHQFTAFLAGSEYRERIVFQSLLHQGISLLRIRRSLFGSWKPRSVSIPSSSGHQFTAHWPSRQERECYAVSIPSSSGHQFTG